jgi:C-terminal processing protease CtpA/Prc
MTIKKLSITAATAALLLSTGCDYAENDDIIVSQRSHEALEQQQQQPTPDDGKDYTIWAFVHDFSYMYYVWCDNVPYKIDYSKYDTPNALFDSFRHKDDRFSTVVNNYTEVKESFSNIYETDGIISQLYRDGESGDKVVAMVKYVYDNSPAKEAGIKRGYAIHKVNGTQLTTANYSELLDQKTCTYTYSVITTKYVDGEPKISYGDDQKDSPAITKKQMDIDPILKTDVINKNGRRIGYFLYDAFTDNTDCVIKAIEKLTAQQIDDLVLDLRINGGGYTNTLDTLASMLVPDGHEGDTFLVDTYNSSVTAELRRQYKNKDFNKSHFSPMDVKLNLPRLYVLTSRRTASASEQLISGLMPYMDVVIIGESTYGKFTTNVLLNDTDDQGSDTDGIPYREWAVYLCIATCTNSLGEMNFKDGFKPNYEIADTYQYELGDENEPLLAKAIELCTGSIAKSAKKQPAPQNGYIGHHGKPSDKYGLIDNRQKL